MPGISGGQGLVQFGELGLAFVLSALIGLEREYRQKSAGLRTHTLVGVAAALFMLVSKYGFSDVVLAGRITLDPSRVAAQIVSGIGFLGAGIIFVRRDAVRGLTTAAVVWLVAAIGMACGGGLAGLAIAVTAAYFVALYPMPALIRRLPVVGSGASTLQLAYEDGRGVLRRVLEVCAAQRFRVAEVNILGEDGTRTIRGRSTSGIVDVELDVYGKGSVTNLAALLQEVEGVLTIRAGDPEAGD
ncbi:MAG: MgtC/SapB family protein [Streptosporangiaceae bacterium]|nr:MgtC/SapB family protein [Streptosporangiaceae bacterium]